jgi:hypothetical protein
MRTFHLNRRIHLYLGLMLLPWFLMYGISSIPFSHAEYFQERDRAKGLPDWIPRFERDYDIEVPTEGTLRPVGARIMADTGLQGAFGTYRAGPDQVNVYVYSFWKSTQVKYRVREKKLIAEDRRFRWREFFTGMHARGGFQQGGLQNLWSVVVDLVCIGMALWVVTGFVMWWRLQARRFWGWLALAGGTVAFSVFLLRL